MSKVKFQIKGPVTIGKGHPIPELPRKIIESKLPFGESKESKAKEKK